MKAESVIDRPRPSLIDMSKVRKSNTNLGKEDFKESEESLSMEDDDDDEGANASFDSSASIKFGKNPRFRKSKTPSQIISA